jgi:4-hydroxybenzoate polyprenyltransferase
MFSRSTLQHLRLPFSVFLMPVFCFALSQASELELSRVLLVFVAVHLFLYPASNGFNSYYDKDEQSIGGLEFPPPVTNDLLYASLLFDAVTIGLGLFISWQFALLLLGYGLVSKAYSHPAIRLKKYPWLGLLTVALVQGAYTYWMCYVGLTGTGWTIIAEPRILAAAGLSAFLLLGSYPMTQIYQHEEDSRRGDHTISLFLGIRGTFVWTAVVFTLAMLGFWWYFTLYYSLDVFLVFLFFLTPVLLYFLNWARKAWLNPEKADYRHTMRLNLISSVCLIAAFLAVHFLF